MSQSEAKNRIETEMQFPVFLESGSDTGHRKKVSRPKPRKIDNWVAAIFLSLLDIFLGGDGGGGGGYRKQSTFVLKSFDFLINVRQQR